MTPEILDQVASANFTFVAALHAQPLAEPTKCGERFVLAKSALYREVRLPWLYSCLKIATINGLPTPYGDTSEVVRFDFTPPPAELWRQFREEACKALPNECAALFIWNTESGSWRLAMRTATHVGPAHIDYVEPTLGDDELAVIDVHSHGKAPAYFSRKDYEDDYGGIKIAAVFGRVGSETPNIALRLVCLDSMVPLELVQVGQHPPILVKQGDRQ